MENFIKLNQDQTDLILQQERWETLGLDPTKGLLIMGPVGVGKTYLIGQYLKNKNRGPWLEPHIIRKGIEVHGLSFFDQFLLDHLTFDDLGKEPEMVNVFGTAFFPGQELIDIRYSVFKRTVGKNRTCFTTNLNRELLQEKYGERCFSRLTEMCNFVAILGDDRRK